MRCGYKTERNTEVAELSSQFFIQIVRESPFNCAPLPGKSGGCALVAEIFNNKNMNNEQNSI